MNTTQNTNASGYSVPTLLLIPISIFCFIGSIFFFSEIFSGKSNAEENIENVIVESPSLQIVSSGLLAPGCFDNFTSWKRSTTFDSDVDWSTASLDSTDFYTSSTQKFIFSEYMKEDLNGDGLIDFLLVNHKTDTSSNKQYIQDCVLLSNGKGWDVAYKCVSQGNGYFYGDCAK